jgi:prepilin-type N-terminal cleavage/methylation domain-containing protein
VLDLHMSARAAGRSDMGRHSDGFSLIELLIALVVTLLVSGAVFGLLTAGQGAFRREPQLTERQQSLRQAMTLIQDDVMRAGVGLPGFAQVFTDGLDASGPLVGTLGNGPTDALEILAGDPGCPPALVCIRPVAPSLAAGVANDISVDAPPPQCVQDSAGSFFAFFDVGTNFAVQPVAAPLNSTAGGCAAQLPAGARVPGTLAGGGFNATGYVPVQLVRYEIANCPPPDAALPCLYRSTTGRADAAGNVVGPPPAAQWQVVARGIEDMQVRYRSGFSPGGAAAALQCDNVPAPAWACTDNPGPVTPCGTPCGNAPSYTTLVTQVQVTLVARTIVGGLQGETNTAAGPARVRGQLTGIFTPRTALAVLAQDPTPTPRWR